MVSAKMIVGVVLAVTVGMVFFPAVTNAVDTSTGTQSVTNESVTAQHGEYVDLDGYDIDSGSVTVYGYNDSSDDYEVATSPDDYEIKYEPGEFKANSSSTLINDSEEALVSYDYQASSGTTTLVVGFVPVIIGLLMFVVVATKTQDMM